MSANSIDYGQCQALGAEAQSRQGHKSTKETMERRREGKKLTIRVASSCGRGDV